MFNDLCGLSELREPLGSGLTYCYSLMHFLVEIQGQHHTYLFERRPIGRLFCFITLVT
ncbi:protein of unknown function [Trichlorobacter ammonificans]|uniref:Uncharacterized protein n=1 Tax=Trichlorobacter ammonificans TaxID=2916410 RepID=A0ABN8HGH9_9BACT|nr:protein of unknown function [Trichlorobacter ammonificans]